MQSDPPVRRSTRTSWARAATIFAGCAFLSGCAPVYERIAPSIAVLAGFPLCKFERLGPLSAHDGQARRELSSRQGGAGTLETWGQSGNQASVLAELRAAAQAMGANAIVIRRRIASATSTRNSTMKRAESGLKIMAIAIRTSTPPLLEPCNAVAWTG